MTYATQQNLIDRFSEDDLIQLTDDNNKFIGFAGGSLFDNGVGNTFL